jgi:hypothetical protein
VLATIILVNISAILLLLGVLVLIARYAPLFPKFSTLFGTGLICCSIYFVILLVQEGSGDGPGAAFGEALVSYLAVILFLLGAFFVGGALHISIESVIEACRWFMAACISGVVGAVSNIVLFFLTASLFAGAHTQSWVRWYFGANGGAIFLSTSLLLSLVAFRFVKRHRARLF